MPPIPRDRSPDNTLGLLQDGYRFISEHCERHQSDLFETRILLQRTICLRGAEAARLVYDRRRFMRHGAAPARLLETLFGKRGVQTLDGAAHEHRKAMFTALLMAPERVQSLVDTTAREWDAAAARWERMDELVLFDEVNTLLCRAVCAWAGVPLPEHDVARRTRQFAAMIAAAGVAGPPHWAGRLARNRAEAWIRGLIRDIRRGAVTVPPDSAAAVIAGHRKLNGDLLDAQVAAVELINVLRPTVAIGRFITFAALALYAHPAARDQVEAGDAGAVDRFVQEVRRYYPFFPFVPACVRHTFTWHGYRFPRGRRVVLDLYGTDHHPRLWDAPERFQPERFRARPVTPYDFIPQGGDGYNPGHRCPGEPITVALMAQAVDRLVHGLTYTVPPQDLRVSLSRMPTKPHSGFVIRDVRRVGAPAA